MDVFLDGYVCCSIYLMFFMDVFMVFVSENEKTGTLSHLCLFSWMVMCVGQFI